MSDVRDAIIDNFDGIVEENGTWEFDTGLDYSGKILEGKYPAHIIGLKLKENFELPYQNKVVDIYTISVEIDEAARKEDYFIDSKDESKGTVSGANFVGKKVYSIGQFVTLKPTEAQKKRGFRGDPSQNKDFRNLWTNILNLELEIAEKREDGTILYRNPRMTLDKIQGIPVMCRVAKTYKYIKGQVDSQGKKVKELDPSTKEPIFYMKVVHFDSWKTGKKKDFIPDTFNTDEDKYLKEDIPF